VARVAISQATVVAKNISREIGGIKKRAEYKPANYPYVVPVGGEIRNCEAWSGYYLWFLRMDSKGVSRAKLFSLDHVVGKST